MKVIEIKNLNKSFKNIKAVIDLSFIVKEGEFFAFLGVNGAGKSTTISIMCGELSFDSGSVCVSGYDVRKDMSKIRRTIGVVYQNSVLDKPISVYENIKTKAMLYGLSSEEFEKNYQCLAEQLDFVDLKNRIYGKLSGGQKRRVDIARALIHNPKILILDEPTTGLDPQTRKLVWEVINKLRKENNMTVFLTTHYMEEVVDADYVVILNKGQMVAHGSPLELKNKYTNDYINLYNPDMDKINKLNLKYTIIPDGIRIEVKNTKEATDLIISNKELFDDYEVIKGKMDDVFLNATGIKLGGN